MNENVLKPIEIVKELDKYIVGQEKAKMAVAIAMRNRWRRMNVEGKIKDEIYPNNILMIGPTGVGKTEIARRLAKITNSPFIKVEATRYTEVGYVGRDVESMVRDLMYSAVAMVKSEKMKGIEEKAKSLANERVLEIIMKKEKKYAPEDRSYLRELLLSGKLDDMKIEIESFPNPTPMFEIIGGTGLEELQMNLQDTLKNIFAGKGKKKSLNVKTAIELFKQEEAEKMIDMEEVSSEAKRRVENQGMIFIDEIDKIIGSETHGPDVSRVGVQRDLLPIVEGTDVMTKYGIVNTSHILFIGAGAFSLRKPSELIPEFQGRFPIRVELSPLTEDDFYRILLQPENSLIKQYKAIFKTEGVELEFDDDAIREIAHISYEVNSKSENIGARRLSTVMSTVLEEYLFKIPDVEDKKVVITRDYVLNKIKPILKDEDLTRYIL
uniref:ATP-dependent protease ATPase subunit HslU n=1 Tax=candidate division WOR-3 bacterium TaxID=2052148 RepID=A0A7C4UGI0_UNCW3